MLLPLGTLVSGLYYLCWSIPHPTVPTLSSWVPALGWNKWSALSHHLWVLLWSLDDSHTTTQRTSSGRWSGGGASFQRKPLGWSIAKPGGEHQIAESTDTAFLSRRLGDLQESQEEAPASPSWAVFLGRCSHSCSWWPFSWPPGQRQVSDHPHPRGPTPPSRWHRGPACSACPWSSYPPGRNIQNTSSHPTSYQGVWCWINRQQERQSKACSQEEPVGTSSSSSPPFALWKVELSQKWWQMVATWRKENTKLPLKRAEWVWPLLLLTSASAWQILELVPLCLLNP